MLAEQTAARQMDVGAVVGWTGHVASGHVCVCVCHLFVLGKLLHAGYSIAAKHNANCQPANTTPVFSSGGLLLSRDPLVGRGWSRPTPPPMARMDAMRCDAMRWGERRSTQPGHTAHRTAPHRAPQQPTLSADDAHTRPTQPARTHAFDEKKQTADLT